MSGIPEGVTTANGEGIDLRSAIHDAAAKLGVSAGAIDHKIDLSHFRSANGSSMARSTVKIVAWARAGGAAAESEPSSSEASAPVSDASSAEAPAERAARPERRDREDRGERRDREDRGERRDREDRGERRDREDRGERRERIPAPTTTTAASEFAAAWFRDLTRLMDIPSTVTATGDDERVRIKVAAEGAGRLIGRKGTTLGAIRHILGLALSGLGSPIVDVDVDDPREDRGERREDRGERRDDRGGRDERRDSRPRDDRGERRRDDRGERRDDRGGRDDRRDSRPRDDRGDRRRDDRGDRGGRDDRREKGGGTYPEDKLQEIARRAAEKAVSTGKPITINLQLNSYDRRIVHLEIAEIKGVDSQSVIKDDVKYVQVVPAAG
jgi:predicted RNA-binding protein Jag